MVLAVQEAGMGSGVREKLLKLCAMCWTQWEALSAQSWVLAEDQPIGAKRRQGGPSGVCWNNSKSHQLLSTQLLSTTCVQGPVQSVLCQSSERDSYQMTTKINTTMQ